MISIKVPPLGESIVEATVSRWTRKEGDAVAQGETLVELETDKITVEVPALKAGVLSRRLRREGDVVKVDEALGELDDTAAVPASAIAAAPAASRGVAVPVAAAAAAAADLMAKVSPAAQRLAAEEKVELAAVSGSARGGVITKADVAEAIAHRSQTPAGGVAPRAVAVPPVAPAAPAPVPAAPAFPVAVPHAHDGARESREKMTTRRKRIAENLLQSQQATAHLTTFNEVDMSAVSALRNRLRERVEKEHGVKLTFMPFFIRAACMALKSHPVVNAQVDGDSIIYKHYVNMGIAVASEQGLVVPNIKDTHAKGMVEITREMGALAKRAREGKLMMDDLTGGTFTITNGGVFGSLLSTPILNFPQVGILGLHKIQDRPMAVDGRVEVRPMMYVALTYDHRIIDGQQAVLFLVRIKELMEDPASMLIE
jgi:2-oxoglutarate dehydrogenase E2 component (dihydrolipoamide succinyltransferase)